MEKILNWGVVLILTVMNLPYHIRFKREFIIVLGIISGPKQPKRDINSYLQLLVGELSKYYTVH